MDPTLLLADDSVTVQRVIELTFADEHVRVVTVADGEQAIKHIDKDRPDIVLADVGMPKVDGYGVAAHVKQTPELKHIPVLLLTGAFDPIDEAKARATGCDGVLVKPFEPQALVGRVRELLAGRRPEALWPADLPRVDVTPAAPPSPRPAPAPAAAAAPRDSAPLPVKPVPQPGARPAPARAEPARQAPAGAPPPPADKEFEIGLDELDEAFARLDPSARPAEIDDHVVSEFAQDLHELRELGQPVLDRQALDWELTGRQTGPSARADREAPEAAPVAGPREVPPRPERQAAEPVAPPDFGDWDLPARPVASMPAEEPIEAIEPSEPAEPVEPSRPVEAAPEPRRPPTPVLVPSPAQKKEAPVDTGKVSIATAFSALLAAEQKQPAYRPTVATPALSEAVIEEVVRRVLARMSDDVVQRVVLEAAERLVREEIERIKAHPE